MIQISEGFARRIFETAMQENRCAELLGALFGGGSVTLAGRERDELVIVSGEQIAQMIDGGKG